MKSAGTAIYTVNFYGWVPDAVKPSCWKEKGPNGTQSKNVACSIRRKPHKLKQDEPVTPVVHTAICLKAFDDGHTKGS